MEVSIQAVSPELGVHFSSTASLGSELATHAGGAGSAAGAAAAGSAASSAKDGDENVEMLRKRPSRSPNASAMSPARVGLLNVMGFDSYRETFELCGLESCSIGLASADAHRAVEAENEDLAVPDLAGLGRRGDGVDGLVDLIRRHCDLDLDLRQEAHRVLRAAIDFRVALLPPISFDLGHGHPVHADRSQSVADLVELERLDDGHDDFHGFNPRLSTTPASAGRGQFWLCIDERAS